MSQAAARVGYVRWIICALLFFAATINYIDRQVIGILKPTLQHEFGWSETDYGDIVFAFQLAYAYDPLDQHQLASRGATARFGGASQQLRQDQAHDLFDVLPLPVVVSS